MLSKVIEHFVQGPYNQRGGSHLRKRIHAAIGDYDELLPFVMKPKRSWLTITQGLLV